MCDEEGAIFYDTLVQPLVFEDLNECKKDRLVYAGLFGASLGQVKKAIARVQSEKVIVGYLMKPKYERYFN